MQAAATRFINMTHHACWIVVSKGGRLQRFIKADHNDFLVDLKGAFKPRRSVAEDWISVSADSWLYSNRRTRGRELLYWPLPENQYGDSLILLWDEGDTLLREEELEDEDDSWG